MKTTRDQRVKKFLKGILTFYPRNKVFPYAREVETDMKWPQGIRSKFTK